MRKTQSAARILSTGLPMTIAIVSCLRSIEVAAQAPPNSPETVVVTADKVPWDFAIIPAMVSVVTEEDLKARGARDLRTALELVAGVDVGPGGDGGPASSVPGMWGLKELDAFLLVVDGVPYGGAFNPALATMDLTNVARIEVLRGAAPVMYGATSFVGVIHVIHSPAGGSPERASVSAGSHSTGLAEVMTNLPQVGEYKQSVTVNAENREFTQDDSKVERLHVLYRGATQTSIGTFHVDVDGTGLRQDPYSPHPREGSELTARFPLDANVNPSDGRQDQDRLQLNLGLDHQTNSGVLVTSLSVAHTEMENTRGFLREDFAADGVTTNADGFRQDVETTDGYFDLYHTANVSPSLRWVIGLDWLYGKGEQESENFEYAVLPDGSSRPDSHSLPVDESTELEDERNFGGLYSEVQWSPTERWQFMGGIRLNRTEESREGGSESSDGAESESEGQRDEKTRWSGAAGASFRAWQRDSSYITLFGNYRDTYKPAAVDFGPEAEGEILQPETGQSWEFGLRGNMSKGRLAWEASYFHMDFENLVIRENIDGLPGLANAGKERFTGAEIEASYQIARDLRLSASYAYHDAVFTDYARLQSDGSLQQLAGNQLELSPEHLGAVGLVFAPIHGLFGSIVWSYTGSRFLNKSNTAVAQAFDVLDAGVGYRAKGWEVRVDGYNLTDSRDPVAESELGDAQFYRLPGRSLLLSLGASF